jgi:hypothetical protein
MRTSLMQRNNFFILVVAVLLGAPTGWAQQTAKQPTDDNASKPAATPSRPNLSSSDLDPKVIEDISTPALGTSNFLDKTESLQLEIDEDTAFTRDITRVLFRVGDPIDLYIVKPVGVKKPGVVLYLYDYPTETDFYHNREFCRRLVKEGVAAVGFVPALTGQRYHDRPMKEWFVSNLRESLATSAHDVQMILNYLATRGDLDMDRVGIFGDGSGASIAILAAAADHRIKALDLVDPWGDWPDWIKESNRIPEKERSDYLKPEWLAAVAPLDPAAWLPKLKTQTIRTQFVRDPAVTPADVQQKMEAAVPANAKTVHYDNPAAFRTAVAGGAGFDWIKGKMQFSVVPGLSASGQAQQKTSPDRVKDSQP